MKLGSGIVRAVKWGCDCISCLEEAGRNEINVRVLVLGCKGKEILDPIFGVGEAVKEGLFVLLAQDRQ